MFDDPTMRKQLTLLGIVGILLIVKGIYSYLTDTKKEKYLAKQEAEIEAYEKERIEQLVAQLKKDDLTGVESGMYSLEEIKTAQQILIDMALTEIKDEHKSN